MSLPRSRDRLLSLKYSTIEASFSVPMLTLTMGNLAFAISFATKVLGWSPTAIGLMAAAPHLSHFLQPPITNWLRQRSSLLQIMILTFTLNALPWTLACWFPWLGEGRHLAFALIIAVTSLANSVCGVVWSAAIAEVVPLAIRGKFFSRRNLTYGVWTLLVVLIAGQVVDAAQSALHIFGVIFAAAALARMIALFFLLRMKFPASVTELRPPTATLKDYLTPLRDKNYLPLLLFIGLWGFCLNLGLPFYNVYVLRHLPFTVGDLSTLSMLGILGGLVSLKTWGALSDRFGNKPVLFTSAMIWAGTAMLSWLFASPTHYRHLYLNYFIVGFTTAGFQLCQFNLMLKMAPAANRAHYISVFFSFTSLLTALGPMVGGKLLVLLPQQLGTFLGEPILNFHLLFVGSLFLGFMAVHVLQVLREPSERPVTELMRVMRNMREFNPVLGLASLAQFISTPREMARFAQKSLRSLRKQTDAVTDVGGELVEGSWRALKGKFEERD